MKRIEFIYGGFHWDGFEDRVRFAGDDEVNNFLADDCLKVDDIHFMPFAAAQEGDPDRMAVAIIYEVEADEDDG